MAFSDNVAACRAYYEANLAQIDFFCDKQYPEGDPLAAGIIALLDVDDPTGRQVAQFLAPEAEFPDMWRDFREAEPGNSRVVGRFERREVQRLLTSMDESHGSTLGAGLAKLPGLPGQIILVMTHDAGILIHAHAPNVG